MLYEVITIQNPEVIPKLKTLIDGIVGGLENPGTGVMFTLPVDWAAGLVPEEEEI